MSDQAERTPPGSLALPVSKQERFCHEYLVDLCATKAAIRAEYSAKTAGQYGYQLLQKPSVQERIAFLKEERMHRLGIRKDRVLEELARIAFSNVDHYRVDDLGRVVLDAEAPETALSAVSSIDRKRRTITQPDGTEIEDVDVKVRLWNKNTALQDLGKHLGLFGPDGSEENPFHHHVLGLDFTPVGNADSADGENAQEGA